MMACESLMNPHPLHPMYHPSQRLDPHRLFAGTPRVPPLFPFPPPPAFSCQAPLGTPASSSPSVNGESNHRLSYALAVQKAGRRSTTSCVVEMPPSPKSSESSRPPSSSPVQAEEISSSSSNWSPLFYQSQAPRHEVYLKQVDDGFSKTYRVVPWATTNATWYWLVGVCKLRIGEFRSGNVHVVSAQYTDPVHRPVLQSYLLAHHPPPWE